MTNTRPTPLPAQRLPHLATLNIQKKWTQPLQNWGITVSQLSTIFSGRL
ncbi:hypothetical protein [Chitinophaga sp. CF118]|nr:hypothetical protein [Chitinophaga sp. CF118]